MSNYFLFFKLFVKIQMYFKILLMHKQNSLLNVDSESNMNGFTYKQTFSLNINFPLNEIVNAFIYLYCYA